jgi:hypothetical protein
MNTIPINEYTPPKKPGLYLWKNSCGVEFINVRLIPKRIEFGMEWGEYLAGPNDRNICNLMGEFSKRLILTEHGLQEAE